MNKKFIYRVADEEFISENEAFGAAFKWAKERSKELGVPIYRTTITTVEEIYNHSAFILNTPENEKKTKDYLEGR